MLSLSFATTSYSISPPQLPPCRLAYAFPRAARRAGVSSGVILGRLSDLAKFVGTLVTNDALEVKLKDLEEELKKDKKQLKDDLEGAFKSALMPLNVVACLTLVLAGSKLVKQCWSPALLWRWLWKCMPRCACTAETTGLTRSAERVSLADASFREGSDRMAKHLHSTCLTRPNLGYPTARDC
jgi:hypothetical protein